MPLLASFRRLLRLSFAVALPAYISMAAAYEYVHNWTMPAIVEMTYNEHVKLIRFGVPSRIVKQFYDEAIFELAEEKCKEEEAADVKKTCVNMIFSTESMETEKPFRVRRLADFLSLDASKPPQLQLFPLYQKQKNMELPLLNTREGSITSQALTSTMTNLASLSSQSQPVHPNSTFPSDNDLLYDAEFDDTKCNLFSEAAVTLPATSAVAYVLGLAMHVYFSGGNVIHAKGLVENVTSLVYDTARCERQRAGVLRVSADPLQTFASEADVLIANAPAENPASALQFTLLPDPFNVGSVVKAPYRYFEEEIAQLSSLSSFGRTKILKSSGRRIELIDMSALMFGPISFHSYRSSYLFYSESQIGSSDFGNGDNGGSYIGIVTPSGLRCPSGWTFVNRIAPVRNPLERCCPETCSYLSGSLFTISVGREQCCESCNLARCGRAGDNAGDFSIAAGTTGPRHSETNSSYENVVI